MKYHQYAQLFPMQSDEEIQKLADDIAKHGLRQPIVIDEDETILDGRNRAAACAIAQVKPVYEPFVGNDAAKLAYVVSVNVHRRHLSTSQRSDIAAKIATMTVGANQHTDKKKKEGPSNDGGSPKVSTKQAAKLMNVSESSVERAKAKETPAKPKAKPANKKPKAEPKATLDPEQSTPIEIFVAIKDEIRILFGQVSMAYRADLWRQAVEQLNLEDISSWKMSQAPKTAEQVAKLKGDVLMLPKRTAINFIAELILALKPETRNEVNKIIARK